MQTWALKEIPEKYMIHIYVIYAAPWSFKQTIETMNYLLAFIECRIIP